MGSQTRMIRQLRELSPLYAGKSDDALMDLVRQAEVLESAGDRMSEAVSAWLFGDKDSVATVADLEKIIADLEAAKEKLRGLI